jgi:hypothetical protein
MNFEEWWVKQEEAAQVVFGADKLAAKRLAHEAWVESRKGLREDGSFDEWWPSTSSKLLLDEAHALRDKALARIVWNAAYARDIVRGTFGRDEGGIVRVKLFHDSYVFDVRYAVGPLSIPPLENPVGPFLDVRDRVRRLALRAADETLNALIKHRLGLARPPGRAADDSPDGEGHTLDGGDGG